MLTRLGGFTLADALSLPLDDLNMWLREVVQLHNDLNKKA